MKKNFIEIFNESDENFEAIVYLILKLTREEIFEERVKLREKLLDFLLDKQILSNETIKNLDI